MIIKQSDLSKIRNRHADKKIVFTSGSFDIPHKGHVEFFRWCKQQGDIFVVALNSDELIRQKKGPTRPVMPLDERLFILSEFSSIDYVLEVEGDDDINMPWLDTAETLHPDICILGADWAHKEYDRWQQRLPYATITVAPERAGLSTSMYVNKILLSNRLRSTLHLTSVPLLGTINFARKKKITSKKPLF